tara:strand:+ start:273 stop:1412 length:1140 start_codon:yes stop_codon:yes gene_type:complete
VTRVSFANSRSSPIVLVHEALGADFFVWNQMPVSKSYSGGVESEHKAIRKAAGLTDMSGIKKIWLKGSGVSEVIDFLITRDCNKIKPGVATYAALLNENGFVIDDAIVFRLSPLEFEKFDASWLICFGAGFGVDYLTKSLDGTEVIARADDDTACLMLQGPHAATVMKRVVKGPLPTNLRRFEHGVFSISDSDVMIARTSYSGEDGFEIFVKSQHAIHTWNYLVSNGAVPVGFDAIDIARIEAGLLFFGRDMSGFETPTELGLDFILDKSKKNFRGKTAWQKKLQMPRRLTVGLTIDGLEPLYEGTCLCVNKLPVGKITSYAVSSWLNKTVAIAQIKPELAVNGNQINVCDESCCSVKSRQGIVCSRRFYSNFQKITVI